MRMNRKAALAAGASLGIAFVVACSDTPTAPASRAAFIPKSSFALNDLTTATPVAGQLKICKEGNIGGTFAVTFEAGAGGAGVPSAQNPITVENQTCRIAGLDAGDANQQKGDIFHITENAAADPANTTQTLTSCVDLSGPTPCANFANNYFINNVHGVTVTYTNVFTPPTGNEGCTPGYWKQDQHFDSYPAGITPSTLFSSIFGVGGSLTFLEALELNGGGTNALWRHGAAAYLNALSSGVDYQYTTAQVIAIVNGTGAFAGLSVEDRKNLLDAANNGVGGCPLN